MPGEKQLEPLEFRPSARLQKYLGQELIADPNLAIIEFVKNAYDAGATHVRIEFVLDTSPTRLIIADNGSGMSEGEFRDNWMRPGFSHKAAEAPPRPPAAGPGARSEARRLERARIPAGEKGLGRMAAGRLGDRLDVYTRPSGELPWLHVPFNWSDFDDMTKAMDDVHVLPDFDSPPPTQAHNSGTVVVISGLRQKWDGRLRGRPVAGRSRTRLGRLRQDLEFFVRPLHPEAGEFRIDLDSDLVADKNDNGPVTPKTAAGSAGYEYLFEFSGTADGALVHRMVRRSPDFADGAERPLEEDLGSWPIEVRDPDGRRRPAPLACGDFSGTFFYVPPPAATRATEILPMGVLLYRDGIWVEPYGIDANDWVGVGARKAQRQGHALQPASFTGQVLISRQSNPGLEDMSNRMGLLENEEAEEFLYLVREEFRTFEQLVYEEVLEKRWEGNKAKEAGEKALDEAEAAAIFLQSLAHSVRQPLEGLQVELAIVEGIARRTDLPDDARESLEGVLRRAGRHADSAGRLVQEALRFEIPKFSEVPLGAILEVVSAQSEPAAESRGVDLRFGDVPEKAEVLVARRLIEQALAALVANAIQATRPDDREPWVSVEPAQLENGDWVVRVADNAGGIEDYREGQSLASIRSTQGRPGVGLRLAELAATSSQGRLSVESTGPNGTCMRLALPDRAAGLRASRTSVT